MEKPHNAEKACYTADLNTSTGQIPRGTFRADQSRYCMTCFRERINAIKNVDMFTRTDRAHKTMIDVFLYMKISQKHTRHQSDAIVPR